MGLMKICSPKDTSPACAIVNDSPPSVDELGPDGYPLQLGALESDGAGGYIRGWAYEPALETRASYVDVYVNGANWARVLANKPRQDIAATGSIPDPFHGFEVFVSNLPDGSDVRVYLMPFQRGMPRFELPKHTGEQNSLLDHRS